MVEEPFPLKPQIAHKHTVCTYTQSKDPQIAKEFKTVSTIKPSRIEEVNAQLYELSKENNSQTIKTIQEPQTASTSKQQHNNIDRQAVQAMSQFKKPTTLINHSEIKEHIITIIVLDVYTPRRFWFVERSEYDKLNRLMKTMKAFYDNVKGAEMKIFFKDARKGMSVAALFCNLWHRATILKVLPNNKVRLFYVDFGTVDEKALDGNVLQLLDVYLEHPAFARRGILAYVRPIGDKWSEESINKFSLLVLQKKIEAKLYQYNAEDSSYFMGLQSFKPSELIITTLYELNLCKIDEDFLNRRHQNEISFNDREDGSFMDRAQALEKRDSWLPKVKKMPGNSTAMNPIAGSSLIKQGSKKADKETLRHVVLHNFNNLRIASVKQICIHVVRTSFRFCFYLVDELGDVQQYLDNFK